MTWARLISCTTVAAGLLGGCGYPVDLERWIPDFGFTGDHGAIALNATDMVGALTARYPSQDEADARALKLCGQGCSIVLRFEGAGTCGALASDSETHFGVGTGVTPDSAAAAALGQCRDAGGSACAVGLQGCNS